MTTAEKYELLESIKRECGLIHEPPEMPDVPMSSKGMAHHRFHHRSYHSKTPRIGVSPYRNIKPLPGEIALKEFLMDICRREGLHYTSAFQRYKKVRHKLKIRTVNPRVVFVTVAKGKESL